MLKKIRYEKYEIFSIDSNYLQLGIQIVNKKYKIIKKLKDTKRNFVAIIEINNKKYVFKEPRNEYRIPQRKIMTLLKKGEAVTTLKNINRLNNEGFSDFVKPLLAITSRKFGMIEYSGFLMEYFEGIIDINKNLEFVKLVKKMHKNRVYHGDFNPGNFLVKDNVVKIIDTQAKKMFFGKYRAHYDMLTMKMDSYKEMKYPYEKDIFYYFALGVKKLKRLKFIEKIKEKKKKLRDKGWKI
ncbi:lipopolysaccharide core heptose(II) kinase RfaY [uncultured Cetobacterium sp.]|uniref:lipopolysaccharide core heptose(II) kinase RfaY n=1 Tax=uncultured Cetobacterium sp. TaxID=527638 RepID=UPI0026331E1F|nr:lipopolysaccharide core heptose(II) kinase RfaY [uncultured Cetobacterium sp.]